MTRAILLVDHGSRLASANAGLDEVAEQLRARLPDRIVRVAHLEVAPPDIGEAIDACVAAGAIEIVVHPYFLSPCHQPRHRRVRQAAARRRNARAPHRALGRTRKLSTCHRARERSLTMHAPS
jgi:sirohydrochlorin ferrochelatase